MKNEIIKIQGIEYKFVIIDEKIKYIVRIENNTEIICQKDEIKRIIDLLNENLKNKYNENDIDTIYNESIIDIIIEKVNNHELKNTTDIENYLKQLRFDDKKINEIINELNEYYKNILHSNSNEVLEDYFLKSINAINNAKNSKQKTYINFEEKNSIIKQTIQIVDEKEQKNITILEKSYDNTLETRSHLINPLIDGIISSNETLINQVNPTDIDRADYSLFATNNIYFNIKNCKRSYANEIFKHVNEIKTVSDNKLRDDNISYDDYRKSDKEEQLNNDLEDYGNLTKEERDALKEEKGITRVRTFPNKNNSAHINPIILFLLILFGIIILIFIGYIILK